MVKMRADLSEQGYCLVDDSFYVAWETPSTGKARGAGKYTGFLEG